MHFALASRAQTALSMHAPLALCEVPSTFAELLVFDRMLEEEPDAATRTALVRQELESGFVTVFRQTMMVRYEQDAYGARQGGQALTADRLSGFWIARSCRRATGAAGRTSRTSSTPASTPTRTPSRTSRA
jgi:oligoendopeptidase F